MNFLFTRQCIRVTVSDGQTKPNAAIFVQPKKNITKCLQAIAYGNSKLSSRKFNEPSITNKIVLIKLNKFTLFQKFYDQHCNVSWL